MTFTTTTNLNHLHYPARSNVRGFVVDNMNEHTNSWGVTHTVGQTGRWDQRFRREQRDDVLTIVSFTPSGQFMRVTSSKGNNVYLFSTETLNLKGSHMGISGIRFN